MNDTLKYLVIDDSEIDRMMVSILLSNVFNTTEIKFAIDGEDGIEWLNNNKHAIEDKLIIFLDIFMPKMDGFEFMDAFMQFHKDIYDKVEVYMLTSSIDPNDEAKASKFDAIKSFINKPLRKEKLVEIFGLREQ